MGKLGSLFINDEYAQKGVQNLRVLVMQKLVYYKLEFELKFRLNLHFLVYLGSHLCPARKL